MNATLDNLRYLNKSEPLQHELTFNELQARPTGFQTAIPVDTTLEQMNSLAFKSLEGALFESVKRAEKLLYMMVNQSTCYSADIS